MKSIFLIGAGGHSVSCIDVIEAEGKFTIDCLVTSGPSDSCCMGYPIRSERDDLDRLVESHQNALIAIGQIKTATPRQQMYLRLVAAGAIFPVIQSPYSYRSRFSEVGAGTIIMHGATLNAAVTVGVNCIINSNALIEHGAKIGDHTHISTGSLVNGDVQIGHGCFIGSGSIIHEGVSIAANTVIGAGKVISSSIRDQGMTIK